MRIVHAIRSDGFAGVEHHVARLARAQTAHGDQIHVIGGHHLRMPLALGGSNVEYSRGDNLREVVRSAWRLIENADVLHVHMTAAEVAVALVSWRRRAMPPLVTTRHFPLRRGRNRSVRAVAALAASRLKTQIAISKHVAERVEGPSTIVYPGVDIQPDGRPASERDPVVLVVQRLEPEKNTEVAISAFAESRLAERGWRLEIAGDGSLQSNLADLAARSGVSDAVHFLGSRDDVPKLMARSSILIAPCAVEGLGLSVLEAMAAGLPTVACAAGGHLETLPAAGHNVCFARDDVSAAAAAILTLAGDPHLRNDLAAAGQQRQRAIFTLDAQAEGTSEVYRAAMRS